MSKNVFNKLDQGLAILALLWFCFFTFSLCSRESDIETFYSIVETMVSIDVDGTERWIRNGGDTVCSKGVCDGTGKWVRKLR